MAETSLGKVFDYYGKVGVIALKLGATLKVGDRIKVKSKLGDFEQTVESMQIEHEAVQAAKKGSDVGIKVIQPCKKGDEVLKI